MKLKTTLFLFVILMSSIQLAGQSVRRINEIKKNYNYLWAEATMETTTAAYQVANEYLSQKVKEYAVEKKLDGEFLSIKNMSSKCDTIRQPRGDMVKVFIYIKKTDISPVEGVVSVNGKAPSAGLVQSPASATQNHEPKPEPSESRKLKEPWQQNVIDELLSASSFADARGKLSRMKAEFKIKKYGVPAACSDAAAAFWLIGDSSGKVLTVLGPVKDGERTDFRSLSAGAITSYTNCDAMWFILSK